MQTIMGANGTIGTVLAKELTAYTDRIRLVSRNPKKINEKDELFPADLSDVSQVDKAVEGSEVVYLVIGLEYNIKVWQEKWPKLMKATIDACIRHKAKLVFFDNIYMLDPLVIPHMTEESPVNPSSKKGKVRKVIDEMVLNAVNEGKLTALIARSADFYGPANNNSLLVETVYKNLKKGKKANWMMDANKIHSFTYTPDAAKATAILGNTPDAFNQIWHLPTDKAKLTGKDIIGLFASELKVEPKYMVFQKWFLHVLGVFIPLMREMPEMMYQFDRDYFFDSSKFDKRFNFRTTPYEVGIRETVKYYDSQ